MNRRGAFDFKDGDEVNFRTMLQRLMVELVREEDEASQQRGQQKQAAVLSAVEEAKRLRELKKQEALERSRQRQANPAYFQQRADLNVPPPKALVAADEVEEDSEEHTSDDPFRSYKSSARPKVFVL